MPDVWSNAVPAQIGNLNKDSTHPNPWSPPTEHERLMGCFQGYRIYNGNPKGPLQRGANFLEDDDFLGNIRFSINKGMAFGTLVAVNDIINVNRIDPWRARLARYCFIMPAYPAMFASFVCARELLGNVSKEKNAVWTYPAAVLAPATIWGIFKNSVERGIRFGLLWSVVATAWKWNKENGLILIPERFAIAGNKGYGPRDYDIENQVIRQHHANPEGWKGWPFPVDSVKTWWTPTVEPTWKKHVSPEEAERGPPTNF